MAEVEHLSTDALDVLQDLVEDCANALIYTSPCYLRLIGSHLGCPPQALVVREQGQIKGFLPYLTRHGTFGTVFNSLPFYGSNGGAVTLDANDTATKIALIEGYYRLAHEAGASSATLISNPLLRDHKLYHQYANHDLLDERIGQFTFFPASGSQQALMAMFDDPRPRNIRKAVKLGVRVRKSHAPEDLDFIRQTHQQNMQAIGGLAKQSAFFDLVPTLMPLQNWSMYIAELDGQRCAGVLLLIQGEIVEYFTPVIVEAHRPSQALSLAIYEAMCDLMADGASTWNWGGTWLTQQGVYQFKKKWGTTDLPYYYYTKVFDKALLKQPKDAILAAYPGFYTVPFSALES